MNKLTQVITFTTSLVFLYYLYLNIKQLKQQGKELPEYTGYGFLPKNFTDTEVLKYVERLGGDQALKMLEKFTETVRQHFPDAPLYKVFNAAKALSK